MANAMIEDGSVSQVVRLADACLIPPGGITSRPLVDQAGTRQILFAMDAAQEMSAHRAAFPAMVHVLTGRLAFTISGQTHDLSAGDWLYMPPDALHSLKSIEPTRFLLTLAKGNTK